MSPGETRRLSLWGQMAPRVYISMAMCFPFPDSSSLMERVSAVNHLVTAVKRLSKQRPDLAGHLHLGETPKEEPFVYLRMPDTHSRATEATISFGAQELKGIRYQDLQAKGFVPSTFIRPEFNMKGDIPKHNSDQCLPVAKVKMWFVEGGLCLFLYLHHSYADGGCFDLFTTALAAATRDVACHHASDCRLELACSKQLKEESIKPEPESRLESKLQPEHLGSLLADFPEYAELPSPLGPTQPYYSGGIHPNEILKSGKIFVFKLDRLKQLRASVVESAPPTRLPGQPSSYTVLSALAWTHMANARQMENFAPKEAMAKPAMFSNPVTWKGRVYNEETKDYFGSTTVWGVTVVDTFKVLAAACDRITLAYLVQEIEAGNQEATTKAHVQKRTDMFSQLKDPRYVGLSFDPRVPQNLGINTWRHVSADAEWSIPGVTATRPDAIRRIQGDWNLGGALILPAKKESDEIELLITLPSSSMQMLCRDAGWMEWVDRIVG